MSKVRNATSKEDLTVFVITTGEPTYQKCIRALGEQTVVPKIETIANVTPMNRAFQQMLDRCATKYYIQVDADMILYPHAVQQMISAFQADKFTSSFNGETVPLSKTAMLYFPLFDVHLERQIIGVKIYNHSIMKNYPYEVDFSCEVTQIDRLRNDGYHIAYQEPIMGLHGSEWTTHQIFERYKRLFQKRKIYGGDSHDYEWLAPYPKKFFHSYLLNRNIVDLWAYNGAIAGLAEVKNRQDGEQDASTADDVFTSIQSLAVGSDKLDSGERTYFPIRPSLGKYINTAQDIYRRTCRLSDAISRICLVTTELPGFGPAGGIATAFKLLADALVGAGHSVYILFVSDQTNPIFDDACQTYFNAGIKVYPLIVNDRPGSPWILSASSEIKYWLAERNFDVVHFSEYRGLAYYSLLAKHQGYLFGNTILCIQAHGPSQQLIEFNSDWESEPATQLTVEYCERRSVELADALISPSRYLIDWFIDQSFHLPEHVFVAKNIAPAGEYDKANQSHLPPIEIVFFGKQIELKGVELFCDAIDRLELPEGLKITFLGRASQVKFQNSLGYIAQRAIKWRAEVSFILDVNSEEAMRYCSDSSRLTVIPSLMENSPYVVMECLAANCLFVASEVGGIGELIHPEDRGVLFNADPWSLAEKLDANLKNRGIVPRPSYSNEGIRDTWLALHRLLPAIVVKDATVTRHESQTCAVCITHFNRPNYLTQAIESVVAQGSAVSEIIVVDDGSSTDNLAALEAIRRNYSGTKIQWLFKANGGLASARNYAAKHTTSDTIVFLDEDDLLLPGAIVSLRNALVFAEADVITGSYISGAATQREGATRYREKRTPDYLGLGACNQISLLKNVFGPAVCMVRRRVFEALGGFDESRQGAYEDWAFYENAVASGARLEHFSEPVFVYTQHEHQMTSRIQHVLSGRRILDVAQAHAWPSKSLSWAVRRMKQDAHATDRQSIWRDIDQSSGAPELQTINDVCRSHDERMEALEVFFERHGGKVRVEHKPLKTSTVRLTKPVRHGDSIIGLEMIAQEMAGAPPASIVEFITPKLKTVKYLSPTWKYLLHWRARAYVRMQRIDLAFLDLYDADIQHDDIDGISAIAVCSACQGNASRFASYLAQLDDLQAKTYLMANGDVVHAMARGEVTSAKEHYLVHGIYEKRSWPTSRVWGDLLDLFRRELQSKKKEVTNA